MTDMLAKLQAANPTLDLLPVSDPAFARYGRLLEGYDPAEMIARAQAILPPVEGVAYEPSVPALEVTSAFTTAIVQEVYGGMPTQVGWCYGQNLEMNALEYHRGAEVNVCLTDVILLVGHVQDVCHGEEITYDTAQVAAFYAPASAVVELSCWNLHYAPIHCAAGGEFCALVYLPRGTNEDLTFEVPQTGENRLLFAINKWLLAHPDVTSLAEAGAYPGLVGDDIVVTPV